MTRQKATRILAAVLVAPMLGGCANSLDLNTGKAAPIVTASLGKVEAVATTTERRLILTKVDEKSQRTLICAEPSPDAAEALGASVRSALEASGGITGKGEAALKTEFARGLVTSVGALTRRSQGLQLFRDGTFALCQGSLNGFQDKASIQKAFVSLLETSAELISEEITSGTLGALSIVSAPAILETVEPSGAGQSGS